jgi:serine protease Do
MMIPRTVLVTIECDGDDSGGGSAVLMGGDIALTARHVVEGQEGCDIEVGNASFRADVLSYKEDKNSDLAILKLDREAYTPHLDMSQGELGEHVTVVGYPVNLASDRQMLNVTDGVIAAYNYDGSGEDRITAQVYFGNSGGPVFSDDGRLVGIAVSLFCQRVGGYPLPYDGVATMVPYKYMRAFSTQN